MMRVLTGAVLLLAVLWPHLPAEAGTADVEHPFLLWTPAEAKAIRDRIENDPEAKIQYEQMVGYSSDAKRGHQTLLNLFRYAVLGDAKAGQSEKNQLLRFAGSVPEPLTEAFKKASEGRKWVRGNASFSDRHMRDEQTLNVLRYDVFYKELTDQQRRKIEDSFRAYIKFHVDGHKPWHPDFRYGRMTWLPNMHWPRTIGTHLMAVALKDEELIKQMFESTGGFKYFFDDYLGDGRFYMEEFGKYYSNIGTMMMYCDGLAALGLDQYGYGYVGKGGATMKKFLEMNFAIGWPATKIPGGRDVYSIVSMGDTPSSHFGLNGMGGDTQVGGYLPGSTKSSLRYFSTSRMNGPLAKYGLPIWYEAAHKRWPDAGFDYFLGQMRRPGKQKYYPSLYYNLKPIDPAKTTPPDVESYVAMERGFAMLRAEESPAYWESPKPAVALQFGMYYVHYAHDCFSLLGYWALNRPIYVQGWGGRGGETNQSIKDHPRGYVGGHPWHDTVRGHAGGVVVDNLKAMPIASGENGLENHRIRKGIYGPVKFTAGRVRPTEVVDTRWVFNEEKDEMEVVQEKSVRGIYPGVDLERALFLTDEYLFDVFWLQSDTKRQYDWHVTGMGSHRLSKEWGFQPTDELNGSMLYRDVDAEQPAELADKPSGNDLWDVRKADVGDQPFSSIILQDCFLDDVSAGKLGKAWYDRGVGVKVSLLGAPETTVFAGRPPFGGKRGRDPFGETGGATLLVRRNAEDTTFAALHEPFEGGTANAPKTSLTQIAYDPQKHLAVAVKSDKVNDRILLAVGDEVQASRTVAGEGESFTFADYGFVRITDKTVEIFGDISAIRLKVPGSRQLIVNGEKTSASVRDGMLTWQK
ncbi:MAG: hypothetical protein ACLFUJ_08455 [Phycisphaerae bacterium]